MDRQSFNKLKSIIGILILLACVIFVSGIVYFSKIKIYEDILITSPNQKYPVNNIEIIGKSVFNKEVVLLNTNPSCITLENYYLNNLVLKMSDSACFNYPLKLQINNQMVTVDLSKPNKTLNNQNYYYLNYKTNGNLIAKIRYVLKCNYLNFSNIFKEKVLYKINPQSTFLFVAVILAIAFLVSVKIINSLLTKKLFPRILNLRKKKKIKIRNLTFSFSLYSVIISVLIVLFIIHIIINLSEYTRI